MEVIVLPKDIAHIVLEYLRKHTKGEVAQSFCKVSPHLKDEYFANQHGVLPYSFRPNLEEIIFDYVKIKLNVDAVMTQIPKTMAHSLMTGRLCDKVEAFLTIANEAINKEHVEKKRRLAVRDGRTEMPNTSAYGTTFTDGQQRGRKHLPEVESFIRLGIITPIRHSDPSFLSPSTNQDDNHQNVNSNGAAEVVEIEQYQSNNETQTGDFHPYMDMMSNKQLARSTPVLETNLTSAPELPTVYLENSEEVNDTRNNNNQIEVNDVVVRNNSIENGLNRIAPDANSESFSLTPPISYMIDPNCANENGVIFTQQQQTDGNAVNPPSQQFNLDTKAEIWNYPLFIIKPLNPDKVEYRQEDIILRNEDVPTTSSTTVLNNTAICQNSEQHQGTTNNDVPDLENCEYKPVLNILNMDMDIFNPTAIKGCIDQSAELIKKNEKNQQNIKNSAIDMLPSTSKNAQQINYMDHGHGFLRKVEKINGKSKTFRRRSIISSPAVTEQDVKYMLDEIDRLGDDL